MAKSSYSDHRNSAGRCYRSEQGSMLALASLFLVTFIACAAFCIDLAVGVTARQQSENYARLASLAAIETFFKTDGTPVEKIEAARSAANRIAAGNNIFSGSSEGAQEIGSVAEFTPGTWYFTNTRDNNGNTVNPCENEETVPCFLEADSSDDQEVARVNAFRINGKIYERVSAKFARIFGTEQIFETEIEAIATVIPRRGCFLVDLSPSMAWLTHNPRHESTPSKYGILWDDVNGEPITGNGFELWGDPNATPNPEPGLMAESRGGSPIDSEVHYKDDYEVKRPWDDNFYIGGGLHPAPSDKGGKYSSNSLSADYKVDTFRSPGFYDGPEPLMTVINGLKHAVDTFKERRVAGDKLCVIFHDHRATWSRVINLTDDFDAVSTFLDFSGNPPPAKMFNHGIFPGERAFTNSLLAITEAMQQFTAASVDGVPASNFITIIGDGLHNCSVCPNGGTELPGDFNGDGCIQFQEFLPVTCCIGGTFNGVNWPLCDFYLPGGNCLDPDLDVNSDGQIDSADVTPNGTCAACVRGCTHTREKHEQAMQELREVVQARIVPTGIPLHVILVGEHVAPHTVDYEDPSAPGTCMSDESLRTQVDNLPYVRGGNHQGRPMGTQTPEWFQSESPACDDNFGTAKPDDQSDDCIFITAGSLTNNSSNPAKKSQLPWYDVNFSWYQIAAGTGGLWAPLREPDVGCVCEGARCDPNIDDALCDPSKLRREKDPFCRTHTQQIEDYIDEIVGANPYTLVDIR